MPVYSAPVKDSQFVLNDLLNIYSLTNTIPGFAQIGSDLTKAILEEGAKFVEEKLHPINQSGDEEGCTRHADGSVTTPSGFKEAYQAWCEAGWGTLSAPERFGGQELPYVLTMAFNEYPSAANHSFAIYSGLTQGAVAALVASGSEKLIETYVTKMVSGEWSGTMNLTEPHCGTDLGLIRTKAVPEEDGSYRITGTKIFISAGEHDLTENIIHLVLARAEGSPEGIKGISLFVVPKYLVNEDQSLGERNTLSCGAIEKKMGIHANATCLLNFDEAKGWMIGEKDRGLGGMFVMMNAARIGVAMEGLAASEAAYQNAVAYVKERKQGRALTGAKNPDDKADPLIVHPDIRRMLMDIRSFNEGARALILWAALQVDLARNAPDEADRQKADDLLGLLTPVLKGYFTDKGYENSTLAQQCFGGHGYIREWGMEQLVRDARISQIYEGANGVQALDLVGRKLPKNGGRAIQTWFALLGDHCDDLQGNEAMTPFVAALKAALEDLKAATMWLVQHGMQNPNEAGAASYAYMTMMGHIAVGYFWTLIAQKAQEHLDAGDGDQDFWEAKLVTGRHFINRHLCETATLRRKIEAGCETIMALPANAF